MELVTKPEIKLVGLTVRTNNQNEMNSATAKIGALMGEYWQRGGASQVAARKQAGVTFSVYTDYASNERGDYTYFVGEEVNTFEIIPTGMQQLTIPAATYQKITTPAGIMPDVVIQAWQKIWNMSANDLGGNRTYIADFEVYDARASDSSNTVLDIYIGIRE